MGQNLVRNERRGGGEGRAGRAGAVAPTATPLVLLETGVTRAEVGVMRKDDMVSLSVGGPSLGDCWSAVAAAVLVDSIT